MTSEETLLLKPYIFRTVQLPDWSTFFYSPPTVFPPQWSPNHPHLCLVNSLLACVYNYLSLSLWQLPICKPRSLWISLISRSLWGDQLTVEPESHDARLSPFPWFNESPVLDPPSLMDPGQQIHPPHPQPVSDSDVKGTARSVNPLPIFFFFTFDSETSDFTCVYLFSPLTSVHCWTHDFCFLPLTMFILETVSSPSSLVDPCL